MLKYVLVLAIIIIAVLGYNFLTTKQPLTEEQCLKMFSERDSDISEAAFTSRNLMKFASTENSYAEIIFYSNGKVSSCTFIINSFKPFLSQKYICGNYTAYMYVQKKDDYYYLETSDEDTTSYQYFDIGQKEPEQITMANVVIRNCLKG
ncbi:MAG: hypothetical protein ABIG30_03645 [Candidatus Aenigmatarchaeota archaeon]